MNRLKNTRCYLAGSIENDKVKGRGWRDKIKVELVDLGIFWMDPCNKPIKGFNETKETHEALDRNRTAGRAHAVCDLIRPARRIDLRMVDVSDFLIVDINPAIPTFGTHEEVKRAVDQSKPVILRVEGGITALPFWWFDMLHKSSIGALYDTLDGICAMLRRLDRYANDASILAEITDFQWILFDWTGESDDT